ncbi:hypothetical protein E3N88_45842 [Mikania micrantha]|uniref:Cysteine-rich receptor-like protein kinase 2 n=1 Tax=Mikania micrantha TaxID=192012 RepID=A0A5N6L7Z5_9ASTR|nr:hypothetical protein E3N88_45842 [Mikania micrantha]
MMTLLLCSILSFLNMKESVQITIILVLLMGKSEGDPRSQVVKLVCDQYPVNNQTIAIPNFLQTMTKIGTQLRSSHSGTAVTGTGPDAMYGHGECYGDLSTDECVLCYAEARTLLPTCFPEFGRIHLDGCFMRMNNYSFFDENLGAEDTTLCGATMLTGGAFHDSVRRAVANAVIDAPKNSDFFARDVSPAGGAIEPVYVLADCWNTLNETSCAHCLVRASESILKCLPSSEGRAVYTGCFLRYSVTNFLNQESTHVTNGDGSSKSQLIQLICKNQQENNRTIFIPNFLKAMLDINIIMQTSHNGTIVTGTGPESTYLLAQCYGHLSTGDEDRVICDNVTRKDDDFQQAASKAVLQAIESAPKSWNRHAGTQSFVSGTPNKSAYAAADCWSTLGVDSCSQCLQKAGNMTLGCLPGSMGYALYTGCFMRYSDTNFSNPDHQNQRRSAKGRTTIIVSAVGSVVVFIAASITVFIAWKHRNKSKARQGSNDNKLLKILNSSSLNVRYSTIEKATASFDEANKLGQGGFGAVYKGVLPNGREIAVKRLFFNHRHRAGDFYNEVNMISSVNHKNLVKLVGFSCLGPESALIYEYLPNKSLDHFIFDPIKGKKLNWAKRFDIIFGVAKGLVYLHENSKTRIIHRDIKAANILLDSTLCAKIADFGLARSFQQDKNHISTGIAGTLGYMAPEYVTHGQLTEKVDVYSFGVLILEVVTGMPNRGTETSEYTQNLVSMVWNHFKQGSVSELFDRNLMVQNDGYDDTKKEIEGVVHVGLLCIQEVASLRPTMSMALQMLSKNIKPLPAPANPPFTPASNIQVTEFSTNQALQLRLNIHASVPTVSDSFFGPR